MTFVPKKRRFAMLFIVIGSLVAVQSPNQPMASATHLLPLFTMIQVYLLTTAASFCHPDQAAALVQLKQSFIFDYATTTLPSWQPGTDCCLWEGVVCGDDVSDVGQVTVLDLGGCSLYSNGCHAALFNLTSLRYLDLSMNDFGRSRIPAVGFERLSKLTHLNLSCSGFYCQIPIAIGKLTSLIALDLSSEKYVDDSYPSMSQCASLGDSNELLLFEPSFQTLVANLTNLRELYLDGTDISGSGEGWCSGLGKAVPGLQVLSMSYCELHGSIHSSLSSLQSLTVINLRYNPHISGVVPEFFAGFLNLSLLQLSFNSFSGWFPQTIFQLKNIRVLDVSYNNELSGHLPDFSNGTSLEILNLQSTSFSGIKLNSFSNLFSLRDLGFDGSSVSVEPNDLVFNKHNSLQNLELSFDTFSGELGPILSWISNLKNLKRLQLSDYHSSKIMPPLISNLTNLTSLEIIHCGFFERIPPSIGNLSKLTSLRISSCAFSGTIPSSIGNLKELRSLKISYSDISGPITTDIGHLSKLKVLVLMGCRFSGRIPSSVTNLTQLFYVDLSQNLLQGEIPTSLFTSSTMLQLDLSLNQLSGPIQEFDAVYSRVAIISLHKNQISGQIPSSFFQFTNLVILDLGSNSLTGLVQLSSLLKLRKLALLDLSGNKLSVLDGEGSKPMVPLLPKLWKIQLASCNMTTTSVSPNLLTTGFTSSTQIFDYSNNRFSSVMSKFTAYLGQTTALMLSKNNISGHIPHSICDSSNLEVLDLSYNNFSGLVPSCLIEHSYLRVLNLRDNHFEGTFPYNVTEHCNLQTIDLHGNKIQGQLPRSLSNCAYLEVLDIGNNEMADNFPFWLGRLSDLRVLVLRSNHFYGSLAYPFGDSKYGGYFSKLQIIDIASNNFSGNLDPRWFERMTSMMAKFNDTGNILGHRISYLGSYYQDIVAITYKGQYVTIEKILIALTVIDFSNNTLDGNIPESIGRLVSLHILNMSHNAFIGRIPPQIGEMHQLESLDLSWNELSGEIPQELTNLTFLGTLKMCENNLDGRIPQSRQFATFDNTSYEGNTGLCGPPLSKPCSNSSNPNEAQVIISEDHLDIILLLFIGLGFGMGFTAGILMKWGNIDKRFGIVNMV